MPPILELILRHLNFSDTQQNLAYINLHQHKKDKDEIISFFEKLDVEFITTPNEQCIELDLDALVEIYKYLYNHHRAAFNQEVLSIRGALYRDDAGFGHQPHHGMKMVALQTARSGRQVLHQILEKSTDTPGDGDYGCWDFDDEPTTYRYHIRNIDPLHQFCDELLKAENPTNLQKMQAYIDNTFRVGGDYTYRDLPKLITGLVACCTYNTTGYRTTWLVFPDGNETFHFRLELDDYYCDGINARKEFCAQIEAIRPIIGDDASDMILKQLLKAKVYVTKTIRVIEDVRFRLDFATTVTEHINQSLLPKLLSQGLVPQHLGPCKSGERPLSKWPAKIQVINLSKFSEFFLNKPIKDHDPAIEIEEDLSSTEKGNAPSDL